MVNPIQGIDIGRSLENVEYSKDFTPQEKTKERVIELGLQELLQEELMPERIIDGSKRIVILENATWKWASCLKKRRFGYEKKDFVQALNFLEVFCLYSAQSNHATQQNKNALNGPSDKNVLKAIKEIEFIHTTLDTDKKRGRKAVIKQHVEKLNHLINKIYTENLTQTEQRAMGKTVEKAESILRKMK